MSDNNTEDDKKEDEDKEDSEGDNEEVKEDVFHDAKDHFNQNVDHIKEQLIEKNSRELKAERSGRWFSPKFFNSLFGRQPKEDNRIKEMIISIRDETKRELQLDEQLEEELKTGVDPLKTKPEEKATKLQIITDEKATESETKKMEVTVINEDYIKIDSDDIEMTSMESIKFLINLIATLLFDLFIISGVCHWIYNHLDGLDWYLEDNSYINFHIFFMTLGICGFGFGILVHRIFRGWSSGALNFLHTTITLTTLIFFVIGIYSVIVSLNYSNSVHFFSVHSWLGLLSILLFSILWLSGIVIFVFPRFIYDIQRLLIPVHSFFGRVVFTFCCGTAVVGFNKKLRIIDELTDNEPIARSFHFQTDSDNQSDYETIVEYERKVQHKWQMPGEALLLVIISMAIFLYSLLVNYLSSNDIFRRRLLPEEQGIDIRTRIKMI